MRSVLLAASLTCPSANSFSSLSCSRAASPAKVCQSQEKESTNYFLYLLSDTRLRYFLTRGWEFLVSSLRGLCSHKPLLQTVNAALQLSFVSLQRFHGRLQGLGHGVFSSQHRDLPIETDKYLTYLALHRTNVACPRYCKLSVSTSFLRVSNSRSLSEIKAPVDFWKFVSPSDSTFETISLQKNVYKD